MRHSLLRIRTLGCTMLALGLAAGCGAGDRGRAEVRLDLAVSQPQALTQRPSKAAILATLTDGTNTLVVTRARLLAKQVQLHGPGHPTSEADGISDAPETAMLSGATPKNVRLDAGSGGAGGRGGGRGGAGGEGAEGDDDLDEDDGYHFKAGATVLDLNLDGTATPLAVAGIVTGTYDHLAIHFHKINPKAPAEARAIAAAPDVFADFVTGGNYNIVIDGTWNGAPFRFRASNSMNGFYPIAPALVLTAPATTTTLTVQFELAKWFLGQRGNNASTLLDPNDAKNEKEIARSIAGSIKTRH